MNWIFLPVLDVSLLTGAWATLLLLTLLRFWRERKLCSRRAGVQGLLLRAFGLTILFVLAMNLTALQERTYPGKPKLAVLLDNSGSMLVRDCGDQTRLQAALHALGAAGAGWQKEFEVTTALFDANPRLGAAEQADGQGKASDLGRALLFGLEAVSPPQRAGNRAERAGGVVLLSDGRATADGVTAAGQYALARSVPVWAVVLGGTVERRDLRLLTEATEVPAFAGEEVQLRARVEVQGYAGRSVKVELLQGEAVAQRFEAIPDAQGVAQVTAKVKAPESGEARYAFRAVAEPDEADTGNNELPVFVRVGARRARVLLVEGQPHWESKFLVQLFQRDERVEVTALYRLGKNRSFAVRPDSAGKLEEKEGLFPSSVQAFSAYDVVVLGKDSAAFFQAETPRLLSEYVAAGGTLIFARGPGGESSLARLEPLIFERASNLSGTVRFEAICREEGILPGLSAEETNAAAVGGTSGQAGGQSGAEGAGGGEAGKGVLPALDKVQAVAGIKPLAQTLAQVNQTPALAWQRYGQGRVCQLNMGGLWRWGFSGNEEAQQTYRVFWQGLLRWLLAGEAFRANDTVALISQRRVYAEEEAPEFVVKTRNLESEAFQPWLRIVPAGGEGERKGERKGEEVVLGRQAAGLWAGQGTALRPGSYEAVLQSHLGTPKEIRQNFRVLPSSVENRNLSADPELMRRLAEGTGGRVLRAEELGQMGDIFRRYEAGQSLGEDKVALWDRWWLLAATALVFGLEWYLRRREGVL